MKNKFYLTIFNCSFILLTISAAFADDETSIEKWENLPVVSCDGQGAYTEISLTSTGAAALLSAADKKVITRTIKFNNPEYLDVSVLNNILFQGCVVDKDYTIKRIITKNHYSQTYDVYTDSNSTIIGIDNLYTKFVTKSKEALNIRVTRKDEEKYGFLLSSLPNSNVMFFAVGKFDNNLFQPTSINVIIGDELVNQNPFPKNPCERGNLGSSEFSIDEALFKIKYCSFMGGGETTGYDNVEVSLTDNNPKVPNNFIGKTILLNGESLINSINYKWNHHNGCDSMVLKVAEVNATYALTAPAMAGCGAVIEGAPQRDYRDPRGTTLYQINYGDVNGEIKESLFQGHFLFSRDSGINPGVEPL